MPGAGAGAVSWLGTWWRQVAGAGAGASAGAGGAAVCRCWCCELAVHRLLVPVLVPVPVLVVLL